LAIEKRDIAIEKRDTAIKERDIAIEKRDIAIKECDLMKIEDKQLLKYIKTTLTSHRKKKVKKTKTKIVILFFINKFYCVLWMNLSI
ncbi:unnamed protein product, partial [Rotaria sp. Silwood1]